MDSTKAPSQGDLRNGAGNHLTASELAGGIELSADIDHAVIHLDCPDESCRRAWRAVLNGLEERLPVGVGEPDR